MPLLLCGGGKGVLWEEESVVDGKAYFIPQNLVSDVSVCICR